MRRRVIAGAVAALVLVTGATAVSASEQTFTDPGGATFRVTFTCATHSATVSPDLSRATGPVSYLLRLFNTSLQSAGVIGRGVAPGNDAQAANASDVYSDTAVEWNFHTGANPVADYDVSDRRPVPSCPDYAGAGASVFVPVGPTRVLDTRPATAVGSSGAKPGPGGVVRVGLPFAPGEVVAVALNLTATEATAPGFVQAFPTGVVAPGSSSTLNVDQSGQTIANSVIVPVGTDGSVSIYTQSGAHLLADVTGVFIPWAGPATGGRFEPTSFRALDTRDGPKPAAGATRRLHVAGVGGVPVADQVDAVVVNLTATETDGPGYIQTAAAGELVPGATSAVNFEHPRQTIANFAIVPVSADGDIDLFTQAGTHVLVDVLGWITSDAAPEAADGLFVPVTPERVLDTRPGTGINCCDSAEIDHDRGHPVHLGFDGLAGVQPSAVVLNVTATDAVGPGFVQALPLVDYLSGGAGRTSTLNVERPGQTIANLAVVGAPVWDFNEAGRAPTPAITVFTQTGGYLLADLSGYFT